MYIELILIFIFIFIFKFLPYLKYLLFLYSILQWPCMHGLCYKSSFLKLSFSSFCIFTLQFVLTFTRSVRLLSFSSFFRSHKYLNPECFTQALSSLIPKTVYEVAIIIIFSILQGRQTLRTYLT
jgi:hypothetical protein